MQTDFSPNAQLLSYQSLLMAHKEEFLETGLVEEEGIWYFDGMRGTDCWPEIQGKTLPAFPSSAFNKAHQIGSRIGSITNPKELRKLFKIL